MTPSSAEGSHEQSETRARIAPEFILSALVIAPHPDDEVIAAGGLIHALVGLGRRMRVVIVSDGGASHPNSRLYPPAALSAMRRTESLKALGRLGLDSRCVHFCDFPDGGSAGWASEPVALSRLSAALYGQWDVVCLPSAWDAHPDHAMTRELSLAYLSARRGMDLEYTVWPEDGARVRVDAEFPLSSAAHAAKREAMACYASQLGGVPDDPDGFVIDKALFDRFSAPVERFAVARQAAGAVVDTWTDRPATVADGSVSGRPISGKSW